MFRHSRVGGNLKTRRHCEIPAYAGMTALSKCHSDLTPNFPSRRVCAVNSIDYRNTMRKNAELSLSNVPHRGPKIQQGYRERCRLTFAIFHNNAGCRNKRSASASSSGNSKAGCRSPKCTRSTYSRSVSSSKTSDDVVKLFDTPQLSGMLRFE